MAKIILFADGTGNARTAQFRTNVWKLYTALDSRPESGQVAYYHDGVGTSTFAPLRLIGGVFGLGLGRNIQALYAFLCRNLSAEDDEIHVFGFSRGAFTVRILAGLIHHQGVRHIHDEAELEEWVRYAYRQNRLRLALAQMGMIRRAIVTSWGMLLGINRERVWSMPPLKPGIELVGAWDTVAAYGGPIIEMVSGFDRWIWPLSMPDYKLSDSVRRARHALSLDEEREAFRPLPWDEVASEQPERIKQVWFAGVHSDVGGGYADDGLSNIALAWMLDEAREAGLKFIHSAEAAIRDTANAWGPMHDSRSGLGVAYRYQPRSINALMGLSPSSALRDPESGDAPMMKEVVVHDSVIARVRDPDGYAPIVLSTEFRDSRGCHVSLPADTRDEIWTHVRRRQLFQRMLLITAAVALLVPLYPKPPWVVIGDQLLAPLLGELLGLIPMLPDGLRSAYATAGSWLTLAAIGIWLWLTLGERERIRIARLSSAMWARRTVNAPNAASVPAAKSQSDWLLDLGKVIRRRLRWNILPGIIGLGFYLAAALFLTFVITHVDQIRREISGELCPASGPASLSFATAEPCHRLGVPVLAAHRYRIRLGLDGAWNDSEVGTSPLGFTYVDGIEQGWRADGFFDALKDGTVHFFGIAIRRDVATHWFQPIISIRRPGGDWLYKVALSLQRGSDGAYYARFTAPVDGDTSIFVNDALLPGDANTFYANKRGRAVVELTEEN